MDKSDIDKVTLVRLKEGHKSAFELLYWKYNARLYNFIYSILYDKSLTEDITQTCFLKIWEYRETIDPEKDFKAYIYTIARNLVYKETERILLESKFLSAVQEKDKITSDTEEVLDAAFIESYINEIIDQLPPSRKEIFVLSRKKGLSNKEIALRLSISERTVETQIYRALSFLKLKLKGRFIILALIFLYQSI
ncbi:MAG: RNA polymerase sigma-70 factor [Dysgonomonas sp.]|nr:RNA polymerase sigma-70 factor [Dysgonomonas sp.]